MLYQLYETNRAWLSPFSEFASAASKLYSNPLSPISQTPLAQRVSAGYALMHRLGKDYEKPAFGIQTVKVNKTDVVSLDAQLLGIEELDDVYMASVEFNGMIREDDEPSPSPFREV